MAEIRAYPVWFISTLGLCPGETVFLMKRKGLSSEGEFWATVLRRFEEAVLDAPFLRLRGLSTWAVILEMPKVPMESKRWSRSLAPWRVAKWIMLLRWLTLLIPDPLSLLLYEL